MTSFLRALASSCSNLPPACSLTEPPRTPDIVAATSFSVSAVSEIDFSESADEVGSSLNSGPARGGGGAAVGGRGGGGGGYYGQQQARRPW